MLIASLTIFIGLICAVFIVVYAADGERTRRDTAISLHSDAIQEFISNRVVVAGSLATVFEPPPLDRAAPLTPFADRSAKAMPYREAMGWIVGVGAEDLPAALATLQRAGYDNSPRVVELKGGTDPAERLLLMDVYPRDANNASLVGIDVNRNPVLKAALTKAAVTGVVVGTQPAPLIQVAAPGIVLYAPVYRNDERLPAGFLTFAYRLDTFFASGLKDIPPPKGADVSLGYRDTTLAQTGTAALVGSVQNLDFAGQPFWIRHDFGSSTYVTALSQTWWELVIIAMFAAVILTIANQNLQAYRFAQVQLGEKTEAERRLQVIASELGHRIGNIFQVAQAIVRNTLASAPPNTTRKEIGKSIGDRFSALAAPARLWRQGHGRVHLLDILRDATAAASDRVFCSGPDILLTSHAAQMFALLTHELLTNAIKHGSLSKAEGRVYIQWGLEAASKPMLRLTWREQDGPEVQPPKQSSFGSVLINEIVPKDLSGSSSLKYETNGFTYTLDVPLDRIQETAEFSRDFRTIAASRPS